MGRFVPSGTHELYDSIFSELSSTCNEFLLMPAIVGCLTQHQRQLSDLMMSDRPAIRHAILQKARLRGSTKSICPSEVARDLDRSNWRALMPIVRDIGATLADEGHIVMLQKGKAVNPRKVKGPIRYRIASSDHE